jgi:phage terminase large subunit-like protein
MEAYNPAAFRLSPHPEMKLRTGAEVLFRSGDRPELLRGPNLSGVWLDEASLMDRAVYDIAIGRLRQDREQGWLTATFTPKGPTHWTYEVFATGRPDTHLVRAKTADNPFNPRGFAATLARQYGDTPFARQELLGEFIQVDGAVFPSEWFDFPGFLAPEWPDGIVHSALYLDPSLGKDAKSGDSQAYCRAGFWPGSRNENLIYLDCVAAKEPPPDMVARGVRLCREWRPDVWAYETNGTMGMLAAEIDRQLRLANLLVRTIPVTNTDPKRWRIRNALMPYLSQRRVRIRDTAGGHLLKAQLCDEPFAEHDDASDAAAGAVMVLERLVVV